MPNLILIKHSKPQIVPGITASQWQLSDKGRDLCTLLAQRLSTYNIKTIITSQEPKAAETGKLVAASLNIPCTALPYLHEHDRSNITTLDSQEQFEAQVARFFQNPNELVYGKETAAAALQRFRTAVNTAIKLTPDQDSDVAIVSHGTVITLFVAEIAGVEPFAFWKRLNLPSYVVLSLPALKLVEVLDRLEPAS